MGSIRYETYVAGSYLVQQLQQSGTIRQMEHDGGDIILFQLHDGTRVSIHLIQSSIPLYEIRKTLTENARNKVCTMFILWANMMLPEQDQNYIPEDWMRALSAMNHGHIYGYDYFNSEAYVFPVYFRGITSVKRIEYGPTVRPHTLESTTVETRLPGFVGSWYVAHFDESVNSVNRVIHRADLVPFFQILGITPNQDLESVKKAYRMLARRYHPDTSPTENGHEKMQAINEAYQRIRTALEDQ